MLTRKIIICFIGFTMILLESVSGQNAKNEVKIGVSAYNFRFLQTYNYTALEYNRTLNKVFDVGAHLGKFEIWFPTGPDTIYFISVYRTAISFGINTNIYLTSLIAELKNQRIVEVYVVTKLRMNMVNPPENSHIKTNSLWLDLALGVGARVNIYKNIGVFIEYDFIKRSTFKRVYTGLNYRF